MNLRCLAFAVCGLLAGLAGAAENEPDRRPSTIDGAIDPAAVPYAVKVDAFLGLYLEAYRPELLSLLPPRDSALLDLMAQTEMAHQEQDAQAYRAGLATLCGNPAGMDALEVARRETELADAVLEARAARYRTAFERLTATGRTVVERFVDEAVAPHVRFTRSQTVRLAMENEDEFRQGFHSLCEATLNGRTPQAFFDEPARQEGGAHTISIGLSGSENK